MSESTSLNLNLNNVFGQVSNAVSNPQEVVNDFVARLLPDTTPSTSTSSGTNTTQQGNLFAQTTNSTELSPVDEEIEITVTADPKVLRAPGLENTAIVGGKALPVPALPGAAGPPALYGLQTKNGPPTVFLGVPLPPNAVNAAALTPVVADFLRSIGGPGVANHADALTGALLAQYKDLEKLMNDPKFKEMLPAGAKVVPQFVATAPSDQLVGAALDGVGALKGAEIGLGLAIVMPSDGKGDPNKGNSITYFVNKRTNVSQMIEDIAAGRPITADDSINMGILANNVPVPGTKEKGNFGLGVRFSADAEGDGPWVIQTPDGKQTPMPGPLAMVMDTLTGREPVAPANTGGLEALGQLFGIDQAAMQQAGQLVQNVGTPFLDLFSRAAALGTAYKGGGLAGVVAAAGGMLVDEAFEHRQGQVDAAAATGRYGPSEISKIVDNQDFEFLNVPYHVGVLQDAVEKAIAGGADPKAIEAQYAKALHDPNAFPGLTLEEAKAARLICAAVLGRDDLVELYKKELYGEASDIPPNLDGSESPTLAGMHRQAREDDYKSRVSPQNQPFPAELSSPSKADYTDFWPMNKEAGTLAADAFKILTSAPYNYPPAGAWDKVQDTYREAYLAGGGPPWGEQALSELLGRL